MEEPATDPPAHDRGAPLRPPAPGPEAAAKWVDGFLSPWLGDEAAPSPRFRGGQRAADVALEAFDVRGYASQRGVVWPRESRGGSGLSPWIRHGLLSLPRVWAAVEGGPPRDVAKFRSELLWQEYARHLYARVGKRSARSMRFAVATRGRATSAVATSRDMACVAQLREELHRDGWLPNPARMWLASHWCVRGGGGWREGEDRFFQHLLDGSRAANRLGWQWTSGAQTGRLYAFERGQVERQAPGWCAGCARRDDCPIEGPPDRAAPVHAVAPTAGLGRVAEEEAGAGPLRAETPVQIRAEGLRSSGTTQAEPAHDEPREPEVEAVWLTAESLGDADPALAAHPDCPAVFVFDTARLARWRLSRKRLVFLVECLADLATRREVEVHVGNPVERLSGRRLAATRTPVPGWCAIAEQLDLVHVLPWPWLVRPHSGPIGSFSAWRKGIELPRAASGQGELGLDAV